MKYRTIIIVAFFGLSILDANAKYLGKYGSVFQIEEPDFLTMVDSKLEQLKETGEIDRINQEYQDRIKTQVKRPNPVEGIEKAEKTVIRKYDPTTYLEEDIVTTDINGQKTILYAKDTPINPLDYQFFNNKLLFIDSDDKDQGEYARKERDNDPSLIIILTRGNPGMKEVGEKEYYYYFDQLGVYSKKFSITKVPSLVYQEKDEKILTIKEVALK